MTSSQAFHPRLRVLSLAAALILSGCATAIETTRPTLQLPQRWSEAQAVSPAQRQLEQQWWRAFGSAELTGLIEQAHVANPDLVIASERVRQAELSARLAGASLFPQFNVSGGVSAGHSGEVGGGSQGSQGAQRTNVALGVNYEIDLWGRVSAVNSSSQAALRGSRYDFESARLSLSSGVANAYFQVLSLRMRIEVAKRNLAIAEKLLAIVQARFDNGVASELDLTRQRTAVLSQRASILPLEVQERQTLAALALLLGRAPQGFDVQARSFDGLQVPVVSAGIPSDVLTRRPDIAASETSLAAADANVAAARAALLPTVALSGALGASSDNLLRLASPTYSVEIAASLLRSLFNADRQRNQVEVSESSRRQLVESYRKAVYTALKEVDDALGNAARNRVQEDTQRVIVEQSARALRLSEVRLREGVDTMSTLLDAQRSLFSAEDQLTQIRLSRLTAALDLFKALGGGWEIPADAPTAARPPAASASPSTP